MLAGHHLAPAMGPAPPVLLALNVTRNAFYIFSAFSLQTSAHPWLYWCYSDICSCCWQPSWARKGKRKLIKTWWSWTLNKHQYCWWHWQVILLGAYSQRGIGGQRDRFDHLRRRHPCTLYVRLLPYDKEYSLWHLKDSAEITSVPKNSNIFSNPVTGT